uniref:Uncharacterized protein n=1 Tax=Nothobranchius kuhntae TaxID=321403 RepID=A0A1A8JTT9_NOTKU
MGPAQGHTESCTPSVETHSERYACFPSCTKTDGLWTVPHSTQKINAAGVRQKPNTSTNSGDIVRQLPLIIGKKMSSLECTTR